MGFPKPKYSGGPWNARNCARHLQWWGGPGRTPLASVKFCMGLFVARSRLGSPSLKIFVDLIFRVAFALRTRNSSC